MSDHLFTIKQNDTLPHIKERLLDEAGVVLDGSFATVEFHMTNAAGDRVIDEAAAWDGDPLDGIAVYVWQAGDTSEPGQYRREWQVTSNLGDIITVPNDRLGYPVVIEPEIA